MRGELITIETKRMRIVEMPKDGNCFFSCFSKFRFGSTEYHKEVRTEMVNEILDSWERPISKRHEKSYKEFFKQYKNKEMNKKMFKEIYMKTESRTGKTDHWGGSNFYHAACNLSEINLNVITETSDNNLEKREVTADKYTPIQGEAKVTCYILFRNSNHFDLVEIQ
jgi:hypothetical protein